jgi:hypothetical protein
MEILANRKLLKPKTPVLEKDWRLWEKKSLNIHRGVIDWAISSSYGSIDEIADRIRQGVVTEFNPRRFRGFGFGTILHLKVAPRDFVKICDHIDTRNKRNGVWQWAIVCFDEDQVAIGIHTWLHGYLRPIYESALQELALRGYECQSSDAEIDQLFVTLAKIGKVCHALHAISGFMP